MTRIRERLIRKIEESADKFPNGKKTFNQSPKTKLGQELGTARTVISNVLPAEVAIRYRSKALLLDTSTTVKMRRERQLKHELGRVSHITFTQTEVRASDVTRDFPRACFDDVIEDLSVINLAQTAFILSQATKVALKACQQPKSIKKPGPSPTF